MVLFEVCLQGVVVEIIVRVARVPPVAEKAPLVLHATMLVQLVVVIESLTTEATEGMPLESALVCGSGLVVAMAHVLLELAVGEELMLVSEDLFATGAEIAHAFAVGSLDMPMQVWPPQAGEVARGIGAVVSEEQDRVAHNVLVCVLDADVVVGGGDVCAGVVLELLIEVVGEDDVGSGCLFGGLLAWASDLHGRWRWSETDEAGGGLGKGETYSAVGTVLGLVESSHSEAADVACGVVAGRNGLVGNRVGADEADLGLVVVVVVALAGLGNEACRPDSLNTSSGLVLSMRLGSSSGYVLRGRIRGHVRRGIASS